jgi:cytochrome c biogenesis protein CcdA
MIFYTLSLSLLDSFTTTQQIIIFALLLTTTKPLRNAVSYLAGLSLAYLICGLAGYLALDELRVFLGRLFPSNDGLSDALYYQSEFLMGGVMAAFGIWWFFKKKRAGPSRTENFIISKLRSMNAWFAFGLGLFISGTSFPVSVPYLVALGQYSALHFSLPEAAVYLCLYNIGYLSPMILIGLVYLLVRRSAEVQKDDMHEKVKRLNFHITGWTLAGFGFFSMIDAACYFVIGHALLKGRYF